jgi:hypothetical protein
MKLQGQSLLFEQLLHISVLVLDERRVEGCESGEGGACH